MDRRRGILACVLLAAVTICAAALGGPATLPSIIGSLAGAAAVAVLAWHGHSDGGTLEAVREAQSQVAIAQGAEGADRDRDKAAEAEGHSPAQVPDATAGTQTPDATAGTQVPDVSAGTQVSGVSAGTTPTLPQQAPETPDQHADSDEQDDSPTRMHLDMDMLARGLLLSPDPLELLRIVTRDIKSRKTNSSLAPICGVPKRPTGAELYLMRMLCEAGLLEDSPALPQAQVVRLSTSGLFYVRTSDSQLPYLALVRLMRVEAALNALQMAADGGCDMAEVPLEDLYLLFQRIVGSVESEPLPMADADGADGEWSVRRHISHGIEAMRLPFRLRADWRVNLADGNVAIQMAATPPEAFPSSASVPGLGIVPTTSDMRARAAADYNLRVAHLLAALAFGASGQVRNVWVAGVHDTPSTHECLFSVHFDRPRFDALDLAAGIDPIASMQSFDATLDLREGRLSPVSQGFSLEDEAFCPTRRHQIPERSLRTLDDGAARALGTKHLAGLSIDESGRRTELSEQIIRGVSSSTAQNVSLILSLVEDDPNPDVHLAAERTVAKLVDGTLPDDAYAVAEEFVDGDVLNKALDHAQELLADGDPMEARRVLSAVLDPIERAGTYADTNQVRWRHFSDYPERVLYNRLLNPEGVTTLLVPESYPFALGLLASACLMLGDTDAAIALAERTCQVAPLSAQARMLLVQCHEAAGDMDAARQDLNDLLNHAFDPIGVGFGYYRMAFLLWQQGDVSGAQACYKRALRFAPVAVVPVPEGVDAQQLASLPRLQAMASDKGSEKVLVARSIPVAPTKRVSAAFLEATRAAVDAEVFPVARSLMQVLGAMTRDDVTFGMFRSIEGEPDR